MKALFGTSSAARRSCASRRSSGRRSRTIASSSAFARARSTRPTGTSCAAAADRCARSRATACSARRTPLLGSRLRGRRRGRREGRDRPRARRRGVRRPATARYAEYVAREIRREEARQRQLRGGRHDGIAGLTALQGLRDKGGLKPGERVLINGASGGVGTMAIQIAKALGARCHGRRRPAQPRAGRALGADRVIDRTQENFTRTAASATTSSPTSPAATHGARCGARSRPVAASSSSVRTPVARCCGTSATLFARRSRSGAAARSRSSSRNWTTTTCRTLADMLESGQLTPAIDRTYDARGGARTPPHVRRGPRPREARARDLSG